MLIDSHTVSVDFNGIVLFSYPELSELFPAGIQEGQDILSSFTQTNVGDQVVDLGLTIPIINIDDGDYLVRIFLDHGPADSTARKVAFSDDGYVLAVGKKAYLADAAVFWEWHEYLGWVELSIPPGIYQARVEGVMHIDHEGDESDIGYDIILTRTTQLPTRTATIREDSRVIFKNSN